MVWIVYDQLIIIGNPEKVYNLTEHDMIIWDQIIRIFDL